MYKLVYTILVMTQLSPDILVCYPDNLSKVLILLNSDNQSVAQRQYAKVFSTYTLHGYSLQYFHFAVFVAIVFLFLFYRSIM